MPAADRLEELRAQARYARERFDLYRARALSARPFNPTRLRELEREAEQAEQRLRHALENDRGEGG